MEKNKLPAGKKMMQSTLKKKMEMTHACVCVCMNAHVVWPVCLHTHTPHTHTPPLVFLYIYIYIYIYRCLQACEQDVLTRANGNALILHMRRYVQTYI